MLETKIARLLGLLPKFSPIAVCPQCGYRESSKEKHEIATNNRQDSRFARIVRTWALRLVPARRKPTFLIVIYRRK